MATINDFQKGDRVLFGRSNGEKTLGEVVKVNRAKLKIKQLEARGTYRAYPVGTVWTVPPSLCTKASGSTPVPEAPKPKRPEGEILNEIRGIYASLSPENLSCDGELPISHVRRRAASLRGQLRVCFRELGREVSESEAFGF